MCRNEIPREIPKLNTVGGVLIKIYVYLADFVSLESFEDILKKTVIFNRNPRNNSGKNSQRNLFEIIPGKNSQKNSGKLCEGIAVGISWNVSKDILQDSMDKFLRTYKEDVLNKPESFDKFLEELFKYFL